MHRLALVLAAALPAVAAAQQPAANRADPASPAVAALRSNWRSMTTNLTTAAEDPVLRR